MYISLLSTFYQGYEKVQSVYSPSFPADIDGIHGKGGSSMIGGIFMGKGVISAQNKVVQVASTLAIENMYISEQFKQDLLLVAQKKKTSKELLAELDRMYAR